MLKYSILSLISVTALSACLIQELFFTSELELNQTKNTFDIAIAGEGCFGVLNEKTYETNYTRFGQLKITNDDDIVLCIHNQEFRLEPPLCVHDGTTEIHINESGRVYDKHAASSSHDTEYSLELSPLNAAAIAS